jgi:hypothetical protein|tara:strand:- start:1 stop:102 length:102 start_codon:yes stop_codon:yes gene_type:complete
MLEPRNQTLLQEAALALLAAPAPEIISDGSVPP